MQFGAFSQRNYAEAFSLNKKALAIWRGLDDKFKIARALCYQAELSRYQDDYEFHQACNLYEEAIALLDGLGEKPRRSMALQRLGRMLLRQGDLTKATALCQQGLLLSLEAGVGLTPDSCLMTMGGSLWRAARVFVPRGFSAPRKLH